MSFLGSVGSLYMLILIFLLVIGFGLSGLALVRYITNTKDKKTNNNIKIGLEKTGGYKFMNSWLRLALFSFVAILISMAVLTFISPGGFMGTNAMNQNMYYRNMPINVPMGNMQMTGNMPMNMGSSGMNMMSMPMNSSGGGMGMMNMGNMPMNQSSGGGMGMMNMMPMNMGSGGMGMMNMPMGNMPMQQSGMPMNNMPMNGNMDMMQMMNNMQMQLNQMQQQMMQMQQMNMGGGAGGGSMPSSGGGMGMM